MALYYLMNRSKFLIKAFEAPLYLFNFSYQILLLFCSTQGGFSLGTIHYPHCHLPILTPAVSSACNGLPHSCLYLSLPPPPLLQVCRSLLYHPCLHPPANFIQPPTEPPSTLSSFNGIFGFIHLLLIFSFICFLFLFSTPAIHFKISLCFTVGLPEPCIPSVLSQFRLKLRHTPSLSWTEFGSFFFSIVEKI